MGAIDFRFRPVGTQSISRELTREYLCQILVSPGFASEEITSRYLRDNARRLLGLPADGA